MTEEKIAELIQKYAKGTASEEETHQLLRWYQMVERKEVPWFSSNVEEKEKVYNRMLFRLQNELSSKPSRVFYSGWFRAAALLIIVLGAGLLAYFLIPGRDDFITVHNPSGRIALLRLPDSSKVWLNASTTFRYRRSFTQNREVQLEGEAYFEVEH